ncbi:N-acetylmuramoyl-L-alanine amidase [Thioclava sp. 'Guangxiensis']|uniref:N-acetylmuramoyl-L-alanine amidase n=1 Tax=Thioclava sp. 'Guangxiensis' TaxID=3149044 RepID=UPI003877F6E5
MTEPFPSPNHGERREGARPDHVVLHFTAMKDMDTARERLCDPAAEVSAHWLIGNDGTMMQLVDEARRAWHAGVGHWGECSDLNSRSIGIELDNPGTRPFAHAQMAALEGLLARILRQWQIPPQNVIAHSDMAPARKFDPGPRFDWARLARQGLAVMPSQPVDGLAPDMAQFLTLAQLFGYTSPDHDRILPAVRLRFRPFHDGPLDSTDMGLIAALARDYGQDGDQWRAC